MVLFKRFVQIDPLLFLSTTLLLYILRMVGPYVNYIFIPFLLFYFIFTSYHVVKHYSPVNYIEAIKVNFYLILISVLFLWGFVITSTLIYPVFKEVLNVFIILFLCFSLFLFIKNKDSFNKFNEIFCKQLIFFSAIISVFGLIKFYFQLRGTEFSFLNFSKQIEGTSLTSDYNFYALFSFIGIVAILFGLENFIERKYYSQRIIIAILLLLLSLNVLFSYSRRGFILILILIFYCFLLIIFRYKKNNFLVIVISTYLASFLSVMLLLFAFIFNFSTQSKKNALNFLEISFKNYKLASSTLIYRYSTVFYKTKYKHFFEIIWVEKPDPRRPDTGWGSHFSTQIYPLTGKNVEIVPEYSIGYKMDNKCDAATWKNNAYSYTDISSLFQGDSIRSQNEYYYASVYCFVSEDFDGTWAYIFTEGALSGENVQPYDFNKKGEWQKLTIHFKTSGDIAPVYLYWAKSGVTEFSKIKGHIIFAYPEYKTIRTDPRDPGIIWGSRKSTRVFPIIGENAQIVPPKSIGYKMDSTCNASTWGQSAYSYSDISCLFQDDSTNVENEHYIATVYCFVSKDFDGSWAQISAEGKASGKIVDKYNLNKKGTWQKLKISFIAKSGIPPVYLYWAKGGVSTFSNLKGYVVYAYPEYFKLSKNTNFK